MIEGIVNKIIPFSSVDGPGNRTAIFLQGCNFNCIYCHNPETICLCKNCGACVNRCQSKALRKEDSQVIWEKEKCSECDKCSTLCNQSSSPRTMKITAGRLVEEIGRYKHFIDGITVSGGECTLQKEFLKELFGLAKQEGLSCMIDSNGSNDFEKMPEVLELCDGIMLDVKVYDAQTHQEHIGQSNEVVLKNLEYLASRGKLYEVRTVIVPELFDNEETVKEVARRLVKYDSSIRYKLIKYRSMGVRENGECLRTPSSDEMNELKKVILKIGAQNIILL